MNNSMNNFNTPENPSYPQEGACSQVIKDTTDHLASRCGIYQEMTGNCKGFCHPNRHELSICAKGEACQNFKNANSLKREEGWQHHVISIENIY